MSVSLYGLLELVSSTFPQYDHSSFLKQYHDTLFILWRCALLFPQISFAMLHNRELLTNIFSSMYEAQYYSQSLASFAPVIYPFHWTSQRPWIVCHPCRDNEVKIHLTFLYLLMAYRSIHTVYGMCKTFFVLSPRYAVGMYVIWMLTKNKHTHLKIPFLRSRHIVFVHRRHSLSYWLFVHAC
jgi:hypothetical protein